MNSLRANMKNALALTGLALTALVGLLPLAAPAAEPAAGPRRAKLRLLFANSLIQNVNRNDVMAAFKLWIDAVGRNRGYLLETETEGYDRLEEVEQRLREKTLDLAIFTTVDYLQFAEGGPLQPVFSPVRKQATLFDDYVLVTRRDRNLSDLSGLRGKSVAFYQYGANLSRRWMEVILGESGLSSVDDFFGTKSEFSRASSVVLPVFFGKFDAGVVNRSSLDTMKELNPQVGSQLQVLANSPSLPESVICLHRDYPNIRDDLLSGLAELHTEPRGQQLLLIFKIEKLVPFKPDYLNHTRDLMARQKLLGTAPAHKAAAKIMGGVPKS